MKNVYGIAAVDMNYGIGYKNQLLFHIPNDMRFFKMMTHESIVVMGRKTFESMNCKALEDRTNVIITSNKQQFYGRNDIIADDAERVKRYVKEQANAGNKVFIIGGESIYKMFRHDMEEIYLTFYGKKFENVDAYFPMNGFYIMREMIYAGMHITDGNDPIPYVITRWSY